MDPEFKMFLCGMCGSIAVEVVYACRFYQRNHRLPADYAKKAYWAIRIFLAGLAGMLPVWYEVRTPILAVHVGASALLIFESMGQAPPTIAGG